MKRRKEESSATGGKRKGRGGRFDGKIMQQAAEFPKQSRGIYYRAMEGRSRKAAMDAFCIMCMGYSAAEVRACSNDACPLHPYRGK